MWICEPIRAGLIARPDDYRWGSLGYHSQTGNKSRILSLDFGMVGAQKLSVGEQYRRYRQFVYEVGALPTEKGVIIDGQIAHKTRRATLTSDQSIDFCPVRAILLIA